MTTTVEAFAPAKINLTLHVTGRREDGYHLLDSLVVFARDVGDRISVTPAESVLLSLSGPFVEGVPVDESNLVMKAALLLQDCRAVMAGAEIMLEKNLPNGAGIGGGSSDAAAALQALAELWEVEPLTPEEALPLGADVPVCMAAPAPQRMEGIGEVLSPVPPLPEVFLVLVNCGDRIPTGPVFKWLREAYEGWSNPMRRFPESWDFEGFEYWLVRHINDLTKCAHEFSDNISPMLDALREAGAVDADMSGSGSTCWGLFATEFEARSAASDISAKHLDWWVRATGVASNS